MEAPLPFKLTACESKLVEDVYQSRSIPLADGTSIPMNTYIPREEGDLLYSLVRSIRPEVTIEIGMANGLSTLFIAQGLADNGSGRHIAIDPFQKSEWKGAGMAMIQRAKLDHLVELVELPSHQALPELERSGVRSDFCFVDGSHLFDYVLTDFLCLDRLLVDGGIMAFDDSDWAAITRAIRFIITNRHYDVALSDIVIENPKFTPTFPARLLRRISRVMPRLATKLRPDFVTPSHEMGIRGRCVVLRKTGADDRDSQSRHFREF
jgi:predicted O-methyltransferase YrrM